MRVQAWLAVGATIALAFAGCTDGRGPATAQSLSAHAEQLAKAWDAEANLVAVSGTPGAEGTAMAWDFYYVGHGTWFAVHVGADGSGGGQELGPAPPPDAPWGVPSAVSWFLDSDDAVRLASASNGTFAQLAEAGLQVSLTGQGSWCIAPQVGAAFVGTVLVDANGQTSRGRGTGCGISPLVWGRSECGKLQADLDARQPSATRSWRIEESGHGHLAVTLKSTESSLVGGAVHYVLERAGNTILEGEIHEGETARVTVSQPAPGEYHLGLELAMGGVRQSVEGDWLTDVAPSGAFDSTLDPQGGCAWW